MSKLSQMVGIVSRSKEVRIFPNDMNLDSINVGATAGMCLDDQIPAVDFSDTVDGSCSFVIPWLDGWNINSDIRIEMLYSLNSATSGSCKFQIQIWPLEETTNMSSNSHIANFDILSIMSGEGTNIDKLSKFDEDTVIIENDYRGVDTNFPNNVLLLPCKLTRMSSDLSDNYGGYLQLIGMKFYQL